MEISIKYLVPLLAVLDNKNYFCMVDYARDSLYFLNEPSNHEEKELLKKEILKKIDHINVKDIKSDIDFSSNVSSIIKDIENDNIIKKYFFATKPEEESNKESNE
jgi:hypothetical protein